MKRFRAVVSTAAASLLLAVSASVLLVGPGCGGGGGGGGSQGGNGNQGGVGNQGSSGGGTSNPTQSTVNSISIAPSSPSIDAGKTVTLTALALDSSGNPVPVTATNWVWTTSDTTIAAITADTAGDHATALGKAPGQVTITATEGFSKKTAQVTLTVTAPGGNTGGTQVVYNNDFNGTIGPEWSDISTETTPGTRQHPATKFLGRFGKEKPLVSLTLDNLPAHGNLTIEFDLFAIMSLDGNATDPNLGPDIWDLSVDGGPTLIHTTFSNITPDLALPQFPAGFFQAYPDNYPGGSHPYHTGAVEVNSLGYTWGGHPADSVYHLKFTFPHTASTVKFNFSNQFTQAMSTDEAYGLKNVQVSVSP